jgi:hypothetical protein
MSPQERAAYEAWKRANADTPTLMARARWGTIPSPRRRRSSSERVLWLTVGGLAVILAVIVAEAMR